MIDTKGWAYAVRRKEEGGYYRQYEGWEETLDNATTFKTAIEAGTGCSTEDEEIVAFIEGPGDPIVELLDEVTPATAGGDIVIVGLEIGEYYIGNEDWAPEVADALGYPSVETACRDVAHGYLGPVTLARRKSGPPTRQIVAVLP